MNKLLKFIIFSAMLVNLGSLPAMDDVNPFSLDYVEDPFQPIAHESADRWDWLGLDMSAAEPISAPALEPDATTRTVRAVLDQQESSTFPYDDSWFNFGAAASSEATRTSTAALTPDTGGDIHCETNADGVAVLDPRKYDRLFNLLHMSMAQAQATPSSEKPARKTRRKISPAASASSSSASAASSTDVSAPSSTEASCSSADDDLLHYCKPLPVHCPWPGCPDHDTYFSPPYENIPGITNLSKHIKSFHKQKHEPKVFSCPRIGCDKAFLCYGELTGHLLLAHTRAAVFQCNICAEKKIFSTKQDCKRHAQNSHKRVGTYHCNCGEKFTVYHGWCRHIRWCPKMEERMELKHYFWCPCGDACSEKEVLRHAKLCKRAHNGMVYVDPEKRVASTNDECMMLMNELEKTSDSSADATPASSSSTSASSSTDKQASELDAPRKKLQPETLVTTQRLPCLWPLETADSESTCNEIFPDLDALLEHTRNTHIKESYAHTSIYWPCPHKDCITNAKQNLSRLIYHFFEKHHTPQLKPWKCSNCGTHSSSLESLQQYHAKGHCTSNSSSASASSSTDQQTSELDTTAKESGIFIDSDGVPMFNIAPDDQTPAGSSTSTDSLTM